MRRLAAGQLLTLVIAAALWRGGAAETLQPNGTAEIVIAPRNSTILEGNTVILTCVALGVPNPDVMWQKDGVDLTNSTRNNIYFDELEVGGVMFVQATLEICSVEVGDAGLYSCYASNEYGTDTQFFEVAVDPIEEVELVLQPSSSEFEAGRTIILTCVGLGSPDNPNITWSRDGNLVEAGETVRIYSEVLTEGGVEFVMSNLEICSISESQAGLYTCSASLASGLSVTSEGFWVNVTSSGAPEIVIAPPNSEVSEGNTIVLTCVAFGVPNPDISWTANGVTLSNESRITVYSELVEEGGVMFVSSMLEICSVGVDDAGRYSCMASYGERNDTIMFNVSVTGVEGVPEIVIAPQSSSVTAGNTVLFSCVAVGDPYPSITWIRDDGSEIMNDSMRISVYTSQQDQGGLVFIHSILEICSVEAADAGYYTCVASNSLGSSNSSFQVDVTDSTPEIVLAPSDSEVQEGNTVIFTCVASGAEPPDIWWTRNGEQLYNTTSGRVTVYSDTLEVGGVVFVMSTLELCSVELSDGGEYACRAAVPGDSSRNDSVYFNVSVIEPEDQAEIVIAPKNSSVTAGSTVLFSCVAVGDPYPSITWIRDDGSEIMNDSMRISVYASQQDQGGLVFIHSILEICSVEAADAGYYTCVASNSLGSSNSSFQVDVTDSTPEIVLAPSDSEVQEGNTVIFTCVASGAEPPDIWWTRNGEQFYNTTSGRVTVYSDTLEVGGVVFARSTLELCSVELSDGGEYACRAAVPGDSSRNDSVYFYVNVIEPEDQAEIVIAPKNSSVTAGSTVLFSCVAVGDPYPSITWIRDDGSEIMNDSMRISVYASQQDQGGLVFIHSILEICSVEAADAGYYTCVASNSLGSSNSSFQVDVTDSTPEIVLAPSDSEVQEGNTVIFTCVASGAEPPDIWWTRNGEQFYNTTSGRVTVYSDTLEVGGVVFARSTLELCSVELSDGGEYACRAAVPGDSSRNDSVYFYVSVIEPEDQAEIVIAPQSSSVTAGSTVLFSCVAVGDPYPSITWIRDDGSEIMNDSMRINVYASQQDQGGLVFIHSILEICSVEAADAGYYTCVASNSLGSSNSSFQVDVVDESAPEILIAPSDFEIQEGNTFIVTCVASGAEPPDIWWTRNGEQLYNTTSGRETVYSDTLEVGGVVFARSTLELCSVELSDRGEYACRAAVPGDSSRNVSVYFNVSVIEPEDPVAIVIAPPDTVVTAGSTVILTCVAFGYPLPNAITWSRNNGQDPPYVIENSTDYVNIYSQEVEQGGAVFLQSILELCGVTEEYSGNYSCYAVSSAGNDSASFQLIVQSVPTEIIIAPSDISVFEGNTVLFTCAAVGNPLPDISWYKTDTGMLLLENGTSYDGRVSVYEETRDEQGTLFAVSILEICSTELEDSGEYVCKANSSTRYASASFNLTVEMGNVAPQVAIAPPDTEVMLTNTVLFTCVGYGYPLPAISWFFQGNEITNDSRVLLFTDVLSLNGSVFIQSVLQLCGVESSDEGEYTCVLSNVAGYDQSNFFVDVLEPPTIAIKPSDTDAPYGSTVLLTCTAFSDDDDYPDITWFRNSEPVTNSSEVATVYTEPITVGGINFTRSILELCPVTLSDEGTYSCVATDSIGTDSANFSFTVFTEVAIVMIANDSEIYAGMTGIFTCVATGIPNPNVTWWVDGAVLEMSDRVKIMTAEQVEENVTFVKSNLEICDIEAGDANLYTCVATVPDQNMNASFSLTVITIAPEITDPPVNLTVVVGTTIELGCQAVGAPPPSIIWSVEVDGAVQELTNSSANIISTDVMIELNTVRSILRVDASATASYNCTAVNTVGSASATAIITVQVPIAVLTNPSDMTVLVGETATFFCAFSGFPDASLIQWFREGVSDPVMDTSDRIGITVGALDSELMIVTERDDHDTRYFCVATQTLVTGETNATTTAATLTVQSPPVLSSTYINNEFFAVLDGNVILTFTISEAQPPITPDGVVWTFTAGPESTPVVIGPESSSRYNFTYTAEEVRLKIQPVELEDEGTYNINVTNVAGSASDFVVVNVVIGARITSPPNDTTVLIGETANFTCVATAEPAHFVIWQFNATNLTSDGQKYTITEDATTSVLEIADVQLEDEGRYLCLVENDHGVDMGEATLTVISVPVVTAITNSPVITLEGLSITLSFDISNDKPLVTPNGIEWSVTNEEGTHTLAPEDSRFTFSADLRSLTIDPVDPADEGVYTLTATNEAGQDSAEIEVDVQFVPTITTPPMPRDTRIGNDSIFMCVAFGEPVPVLSWSFGDISLSTDENYTVSENGSMLTVHAVQLQDEGNYMCIAVNTNGQDEASAHLRPISTPVVTTESPDRIGLLEEGITLTFIISNDAPPVIPGDIVWFFTTNFSNVSNGMYTSEDIGLQFGAEVFSSDRLSVTIPQLQFSNQGTYTLQATNVAGTGYAQIRVDVQAAPRVEISPRQSREHEGEPTFTLTCSVVAEPDATVTWQFNDLPLPDDERYTFNVSRGPQEYDTTHTLVIANLMTSDAGDYRCTANNDHGNVTSEPATLRVLVEPEIEPVLEMYQFIAGQQEVSISFVSSDREYPPLDPSNVTIWFQRDDGNDGDNGGDEDPIVIMNSDLLQLSENGLTLTFIFVRPEHEGRYWVVATNDAGTNTSQPITVDVFINPTIVGGDDDIELEEGESVTLQCRASGRPSPTISWSKDGIFFQPSLSERFELTAEPGDAEPEDAVLGDFCTSELCSIMVGQLTITNLTTSDAATYSCKASIDIQLTAAADAIVDVPYTLTVSEVFIDYCADNPCGDFGSCSISGRGFVCTCVDNYIGITCDTVVVEVLPPVFILEPDTIFVLLFGQVIFFCEVRGNPQPTIEWFKDDKLLEDASRQQLVIPQAELDDRGRYYCVATNTEGSIQSKAGVLNLEAIRQFQLLISIFQLLLGKRAAENATATEMLVETLNEQLAGTMIGNATVYSVAIKEGTTVNPETGEVALIFTFYSDEEGGDQIEDINIEEIEQEVEDDVMRAAMTLGLNITVLEFVRFDGCSEDTTFIDSVALSDEFNVELVWEEAAIGFRRTLPCPCAATDLKRSAARTCGGTFTDGGFWDAAESRECDFTDITRRLCAEPGLSEVESLAQDVANLGRLEVAIVIQLLEDMLNTSSGNITESDVIFNVIEDILKVNFTELSLGQTEFKTSSRLLSTLERLSDAYPANATTENMVVRDSFGFLIHLIGSSAANSGISFSLILEDAFSSGSIRSGSLTLNDRDDAVARMTLNLEFETASGIVFGVYTSSVLFTSRADYLKMNNRTSYILGSVVISAHFSGQFSRTTLNSPVTITLMKSPEAVENGTKTECSFWDQSLDDGFGAWSTDGCRLVSESRSEVTCECDHLTQFALLVDVTPVEDDDDDDEVEDDDDDDSIGPASYVGGLVCILFLALIVITYLGSSDLRSTTLGVSLVNSCLCLGSLFLSYLISYYTTDSDWACTVFSAVFHYLFLVTSLSLLLLALLHAWQPERLKVIVTVFILAQLILPAIVVIISAAPDQDNYIDDEFCRPQREPYWYGLLLAAGIIHIACWCILLTGLLPIRREKKDYGFGTWFKEWLGIALTFVVFEVAWGFGLPSTNSLGLGATRFVFQILFVVGSAALGLVMFIFFVLLLRDARETWTGWFNMIIPGRSGRRQFYTDRSGEIEENPYATGSIGMTRVAKEPLGDEDEATAKRGADVAAMTENEYETPEHIVNVGAMEHEEEEATGEYSTEEMKMDLGKFDDDEDAAKDTKL